MQVSINPINASSKVIDITVEPEKVDKYYQKYLKKAARELVVPGFRKGKAPVSMVERLYADRIEDYFQQEVVDDVFGDAVKEHDIHFLLYPEIKDIKWEKGSEMSIKIEIEVEPEIEFKQLDNLKVPYTPVDLDEEVNKYLDELRQEHATMVDVETAEAEDEVASEISFSIEGEQFTQNFTFYAGETKPFRSFPQLVGAKTGDEVDVEISGKLIIYGMQGVKANIDPEANYPARIMVNSVMRKQVPNLDDEFAKDMEFDSYEQMRTKIADDMRLKNEHMNINGRNHAVISKLFVDNNFELPMKTLKHVAEKQVEQVTDEQAKAYYLYQYQMQIAQEMISMYILNNLRKAMPLELTDEMKDEYYTHEAILDDKTVEAWKEANQKEIANPEFGIAVENFFILKQIADSSEFHIPAPEAEEPEIVEEIDFSEEIAPEAEAGLEEEK